LLDLLRDAPGLQLEPIDASSKRGFRGHHPHRSGAWLRRALISLSCQARLAWRRASISRLQTIYNGWWTVGFALPAAFIANLGLAAASRHDRIAFWLALTAAALVAVNLAIFFYWTQPANAATANWTVRPENWQTLRRQWEFSHAVNAAVVFIAFCAATAASLRANGVAPLEIL